ncbi:MAG: four helix bundle protein [bacterium]
MTEGKKVYDLEERTFLFAQSVRVFVRKLEKNPWNREDIKQLVRSSGSVAANYIEANDNLGEKDFLMRIKIAKKECKESILWIRLVDIEDFLIEKERQELFAEATELKNILGAIYKNRVSKNNL